MSRIDELPPGRPQNEPRKLVSENKDQQLHFALSIAEHLARTLDEERALRSGIVLDYQKLTEEHAKAVARADNTEAELNAFVGDIEALIPEDCRNSRPDRIASVRAAVGFLAQKAEKAQADCMQQKQWAADAIARVSKAEADARMWNERFLAEQKLAMELASQLRQDPPLASSRLVLSTAQPGTGAWAWEQMQRGPEVWVRRQTNPGLYTRRMHIVDGIPYWDNDSPVAEHVEKQWRDHTDWELCAAPGSKESAPGAEAWAWVSSAPYGGSVLPTPAPSAKDGPTEEQVKQWRAAMWGKQVNATPNDWEELSSELRRTFCGFAELCWQAAREGMVPRSEYESADSRADENLARAKRAEDRADSAERRVGELERLVTERNVEIQSLTAHCLGHEARLSEHRKATDAIYEADRNTISNLRAELERVKAELAEINEAIVADDDAWRQECTNITDALGLNDDATATDIKHAIVKLLTPASDEVTELAEWRSWANARLEQFGEALSGSDTESRDFITALLTPANEDETEEDLPDEFVWALMEAAHKANGGDSRDSHGEYSRHLIRLARRNHGAQPSSNPLQLLLTSEQREELAKVLYPIIYKVESHVRGLHQTNEGFRSRVYQCVDAIAPRIARVGVELRELSDAEVSKATATLRVERVSHEALAMGGAGRLELMGAPCYTIRGTREFARAILAAAKGGTEPGSDALNKQYQALKQLTEDLGISGQGTFEWHFARIREAFAAQPPRGRKLTDGERKQLGALIRAWDECHNPDELEQHWDAILTFVESLLAPQELEAPRRHTPFSELFHALWGQAKEKEYDKALWVQAHELMLAPQDEVRVALGVCELVDRHWEKSTGDDDAEGDDFFGSFDDDKLVTQALSASPGDKWDFAVVARRVEK